MENSYTAFQWAARTGQPAPLNFLLRGWLLLLLALPGLALLPRAAQAQAPTVTVTPAGPLTLCAGSTQTLTATATVPGFNVGGSGFNGPVFNNIVRAVAIQADGKVLVGGTFTAYNGNAAAPDYVLRLNADGSLDNTFNPGGAGTNSFVNRIAVQADGKVLVGGSFTTYNGNAAAPDYVLRLNSDGSLDNTFNPGGVGAGTGVTDYVQALAVQADGKVLVGGQFTAYNGNAAAPDNVLRLNPDGSLDNTFNPGGAGADNYTYALVVQADGKVLVGGYFAAYNGSAAPNNLLRLNADGSFDNTFNPGGAGTDHPVNALAVQADGKVLVGGQFTAYNGNAAAPDNVLRLNPDGSLDNTFNPGGAGASAGTFPAVFALALQADGKVLAGGRFTAYNGNAAAPDRVLRLNADGSLDNTFNPGGAGAGTGAPDYVYALAVQADGKVLVAGLFTSYNSNTTVPSDLLRLNADGSPNNVATAPTGLAYTWSNGATGPSITVSQPGDYQATATTTGNGTGYSNVVRVNAPPAVTVSLTPAGPLAIVGGASATLTATATLAAFNAAGSGFNGQVQVITLQPDGKVLVGGFFTTYNGNAAAPDGVLRLNIDGTLDNTFNLGGTGTFNPSGTGTNDNVFALTLQPDGKVLVGGIFTTYNGNAAAPDNVLRLNADGSLDASFNPSGTGADGNQVNALTLQPDGKVLVGGQFTAYNGNAAAPDNVLRLNANGSLDASFNPSGAGADGSQVNALTLQPDGKVLVGGQFTAYNGNAAAPDNVLRLNADGSLDASFNPSGAGTDNFLNSLVVQADGKVLIGGPFTAYNGNTSAPDCVLRLNADGTLDNTFNLGGTGASGAISSVGPLIVQADGKILVGGFFTTYNGNAAAPDRVLRLNANGTLDTSFNAGGAGTNNDVLALAVQADGKVLVGGPFTSYNGNATVPDNLIRLNADGSLNSMYTALSGATFVINPGSTAGNTRNVSMAGTYTATATDPATSCTYLSNAVVVTTPLPTLSSLSPTSGPVGSSVTITGSFLDGATSVTFAGSANNTVTTGLTVSGSGSSQTLTVVVPTGATTGNITVTTPNGTSNGRGFTVIVPVGDLTISTGTSAIPVVIAPGTYNTITVTNTGFAALGGAVVVNTAFVVSGGLNTSCQPLTGAGSFTLATVATLGICDAAGIGTSGATGAVQTTGPRSFASDATYVYNGTVAQVTGLGMPATVSTLVLANAAGATLTQPTAIGRELRLSTGVLNLSGQALTLLSTAAQTAQVNQDGNTTTGSVSGGSVMVQRFVNANGNAGPGYRHFSSPVLGNSLADLTVPGGFQPVFNVAYNNSATASALTPFPNVFGFDPARIGTALSSYTGFDQGYYSPATGTSPDNFTPGRGYVVQLAANQTVDFVGPLNQTAVAVALPRAAGTASPDDNKGWQLLGNPFASSFALAALDNTAGVDNAKYVFQSTGPYTGGYDTYLTGVTGQPLLALGQGFFARTTVPGAAPTLTFALAGRRVDFTANSTFHRATAETRPLLELVLASAASTLRDRTTLYADAGASAGIDPAYDAVKLPNTHGLNLSQQVAGRTLAVNGLPAFGAGTLVPLMVGMPAAGTYALQVSRLLNLPAGTTAVLVDALLNTRTDLATLPAAGYAFTVTAAQAATPITDRFYLNLAVTALTTTAGRAATALHLFSNPAHGGTATLTGALPGTAVAVFDALGRSVTSTTANSTGTAVLVLPAGLTTGVYVVRSGTHALRLVVE